MSSKIFEDGTDDEIEEPPTPTTSPTTPTPTEEPPQEPPKDSEQPSELPVKKPRKKRIMTEEQKQKLRDNLKRGRVTSAVNRAKKKKLKEIEKLSKYKEDDEKIRIHIEKKREQGREKSDMAEEIKLLKQRLDGFEKNTPKKETPKKEKLEIIKEEPKQKSTAIPVVPKKKRRACGVKGLSFLRSINQL